MRTVPVLLWAILAFCSGCDKAPVQRVDAPPTVKDPTEPRQAQPRLQTMKLYLGSNEMNAELAMTNDQVRTGMMFRTQMPENDGMLFLFGIPHRAAFWMKNTTVPLSAAYIDPEGKILEIHDLQPHDTNSVTAASERVQYVLETNQGWFGRHGVGVGTVIRTEQGTLRDTFFSRR